MSKRRLDVRTIKKKIEEKGYHGLFKYEEDYYWKRLVRENDKYTSLIVRERDCPKKKNPCVTQGIKVCKGPINKKNSQCCHAIRRGYYSHRRDLRNCYAGCSACNGFGQQDHVGGIVAHIINLHGVEVWNEMRESKNMIKPRIPYLEELLENQKALYATMIKC